jgi:hypothetical protein
MPQPTEYYFVRVNGRTVHNNPAKVDCYVPGETPAFPQVAYNYVDYCLRLDLVRVGWPAVGDLRAIPEGADVPETNPCYGRLNERVREHLRGFRAMAVGAGVLMPDRRRPGALYAGDVNLPYGYFHQPPDHPFECAHRVGVRWDLDPATAVPVEYLAEDFGMPSRGGWWLWAFHHLTKEKHGELIERINRQRAVRTGRA